jgi:hypothetical protein
MTIAIKESVGNTTSMEGTGPALHGQRLKGFLKLLNTSKDKSKTFQETKTKKSTLLFADAPTDYPKARAHHPDSAQ